ncbi:MAG: DNA gyrase inhibitor YacG [Pirellulaceae bacterium]|nr:DNA gyrase inhibitor YacG [Pirellulaceae bacterium]
MSNPQCPSCGILFEKANSKTMPFCSQDCRQLDLGKWLNESIRIPLSPEEMAERRQLASFEFDNNDESIDEEEI